MNKQGPAPELQPTGRARILSVMGFARRVEIQPAHGMAMPKGPEDIIF